MNDNQRNVFGVIMVSVVILSVVILSVVMLSAVAPHFTHIFWRKIFFAFNLYFKNKCAEILHYTLGFKFCTSWHSFVFLPNSVCH